MIIGLTAPHQSLNYLQLLGAWLEKENIDQSLSDDVAQLIAKNRPYKNTFNSSSGGHYGPYRYPTIHHQDFFTSSYKYQPSSNHIRDEL